MAPGSGAAGAKTRILIVDDSAVMRSLLRTVVATAADLDVAGTAADGETALSAVESLRPDLVLLDVEMPVMDGLVTLKKLRERGHKMPVIMCSSLTQRGARVTIEALAGGASDYVAKPQNQASREAATNGLAQDLIPRIHALTQGSRVRAAHAVAPAFRPAPAPWPPAPPRLQPMTAGIYNVLAIGASTGGPAALDELLPALPAGFPMPVLIVQHMPDMFTRMFAERLNSRCRMPVQEAQEGCAVRTPGIYIARGNWHMEVLAGARSSAHATLHLTQGPLENHCRPAVDVLFRSVASVYGSNVLAVVLTGMGSDGTAGCRVIREHGGSVLAQDQATSAVWGMPGAVTSAGLAQRVLPLPQIAPEIQRLARQSENQIREFAV
jgi:two-component system chemotaxis response regulator CheB